MPDRAAAQAPARAGNSDATTMSMRAPSGAARHDQSRPMQNITHTTTMLLASCRELQPEALDQLIRHVGHRCSTIIRGAMRRRASRQETAEVFQAAWLKLLASRLPWRGNNGLTSEDFYRYFAVTTRNYLNDVYRRQQRENAALAAVAEAATGTPEEAGIDAEGDRLLMEAIDRAQLTDEETTLLLLTLFGGLTIAQAIAQLDPEFKKKKAERPDVDSGHTVRSVWYKRYQQMKRKVEEQLRILGVEGNGP